MIIAAHIKGKRKWIVGGVALFAVVIGLYVWWSVQSWQQYDTSWRGVQQSIKRDVTKATKAAPASEKEYTEKREALHRVVSTLESHKKMCTAGALTGWQKVLHTIEASVKTCEETLEKHTKLASSLAQIVAFLDDEQTLQKELLKLMPSKTDALDEKQWSAYATAATSVQKKLSELRLGNEYAPVMTVAKKQLTTLVATWKAFSTAHQKQDRTAWEKAKGELVQAYAGIPTIADASEEELQALLKDLDTVRGTL